LKKGAFTLTIEKLIRPLIQAFEPYQWELSTAEVARRYNIPTSEVLRFDTNTSPFRPFKLAENLLSYGQTVPTVNEYSDASYTALREALASYNGCEPAQVVIGAGADELLDMIAKLFLNNGDKAITVTPTYPVYAISTQLLGATMLSVPRGPAPDFAVDPAQLAQTALAQQAKVVWLCNPNNPTASGIPLSAIEDLLERLEGKAAVVIDEAYYEFWQQTALPLVERYPNLLVVRTFSKAFSMAGARVGYVLAQAQTAYYLNQVRPPNSVGNLSVLMAQDALTPAGLAEMRERVDFLLKEKVAFVKELERYCEEIYPSVSNFVLVRIGTPAKVEQWSEFLLQNGIVVRKPGSMPGHFRITVRLPHENAHFLEVLKKAAESLIF
jgi:histidinol-phosphate aminotransferase